jgi:hypothetical protein
MGGEMDNEKEPLVLVPRSFLDNKIGLRDFFAGMALQGMHASNTGAWPSEEGLLHMAKIAYIQADAMMKAREEQNNG